MRHAVREHRRPVAEGGPDEPVHDLVDEHHEAAAEQIGDEVVPYEGVSLLGGHAATLAHKG